MSLENNPVIQDLFNFIGEDAATRLCMVFGGTKLYIGDSDASRQRLGVIVGTELAEKLIFHFQGVDLHVPKLAGLKGERRNRNIAADLAAGMTRRSAAMKYNLSERQIRTISAAFPQCKK